VKLGFIPNELNALLEDQTPAQLIQAEIDRLETQRAETSSYQESNKLFFMVQGLKRALKVIG